MKNDSANVNMTPITSQSQRSQAGKFAVFLLSFALSGAAFANPVLNNVAAGNISIQQTPGVTQVHQTSQQGIINWNSFNIGASELTHFNQPIGGITLNRISPLQGASQIYGALTATGKIILVNPAGLSFGPSAFVNVGGLIATTRDISNVDFMNGRYQFNKVANYNGSIVNEGQIIAQNHGLIALVGANVTNTGLVQAELGHVVLASGDNYTVTFPDHGLFNFAINSPTSEAAIDKQGKRIRKGVVNTGTLRANGGSVLITAQAASGVLDQAINLGGIVEARSIGMHNGNIVLSGGNGLVTIAGNINATAKRPHQRGGTVNITGHNIVLSSSAVLDVSGTLGGGDINIGGNYQGAGPLPNASTTTLTPGAKLIADALEMGDGGSIILWSNDKTNANGDISAKAGLLGGNGGFVETSSHGLLDVSGIQVNLTAPMGKQGVWLLDPSDIYIVGDQPTTGGSFNNTGSEFTPNSSTSYIYSGDITNNLNFSDVLIKTSLSGSGFGDIVVDAPILFPFNFSTNPVSLTLSAYRDIVFTANGSVTGSLQPANLILKANNTAAFDGSSGHGVVTLPDFALSGFNLKTSVYYNPVNFFTPTNYFSAGAPVTSYMYINSVSDLDVVDQHIGDFNFSLWNSNFAVNSDIDASSLTNFKSLGGSVSSDFSTFNAPFIGQFDGQNHTISNITINQPNDNYVGFFGRLSNFSTEKSVFDLHLNNVNITGQSLVGGLVGLSQGNIISNVTLSNVNVTGQSSVGGFVGVNSSNGLISHVAMSNVNVSGQSYVGGFAGENDSAISNAVLSNVNVTGQSIVGGFVGFNNIGQISNSSVSGSVMGSDFSNDVGGFVGRHYFMSDPFAPLSTAISSIDKSFSTASVVVGNASSNVGGFAGEVNYDGFGGMDPSQNLPGQTLIENSYSTGAVIAGALSNNIGGFVGLLQDMHLNSQSTPDQVNARINNSYSIGYVSAGAGSSNVAGFVGLQQNSFPTSESFQFMLNNDYYNTETSGQPNNPYVTGLTSEQMMQSSFIHLSNGTWNLIEGGSFPYLLDFYPSAPTAISGKILANDLLNGQTYDTKNKLVNLVFNGSVIHTVYTGADGFYYFLIPHGTLSEDSAFSMNTEGTIAGSALALSPGDGHALTHTSINPGAVTVSAANGVDLTLTSNGNTTTLDGTSLILTPTLGGTGSITIDDDITWSSDLSLILLANNNVMINAGASLNNTTSSLARLFVRANDNLAFNLGDGGSFINNGLINLLGSSVIYSNPADAFFTASVGNHLGGPITQYLLLRNAGNLQYISDHPSLWANSYWLSNDIDASSLTTFHPLGNEQQAFSGNFDGFNHIISNLTINLGSLDKVGLFGVSTGDIQNLGLTHFDISGQNEVGGLVGLKLGGLLSNVFTSGMLKANGMNIGGLVGQNQGGLIQDAYSDALILAPNSQNIGGLVGQNNGSLNRVYAATVIQSNNNTTLGGLVGLNAGTITDSFWDAGYSGLNATGSNSGVLTNVTAGCYGSAGCEPGSVDLTQHQTLANANWDVATVWNVLEGRTYPYLKQFYLTDPIPFSGQLNPTDPATGVSYGNPAFQEVDLLSNHQLIKQFFTGANGRFYYLDKASLLGANALFMLYTPNGSIKSNTVGRSVAGYDTHLALEANTLTLAGNANGITFPSDWAPYAVGSHGYNEFDNNDLTPYLSDVDSNRLLYSMVGNNINLKSGNSFTLGANAILNLLGNLTTTNGNITLGGYVDQDLINDSLPAQGLSGVFIHPLTGTNNEVTIQTVGSGNIRSNAWMIWQGPVNSMTLNLLSANNIAINQPIFGLDWKTFFLENYNNPLKGSLNISAAYHDNSILPGRAAYIEVNKFNLLQGKWFQVDPATLLSFIDSGTGKRAYFESNTQAFTAYDFRIDSSNIPSSHAEFIRAAGGTGTTDDPYILSDWYSLQGMGSSDRTLASSWQIVIPIGFPGFLSHNLISSWNDGAGFVPIGSEAHPFTGSLMGNPGDNVVALSGNSNLGISQLYQNWTNRSLVGLFGVIGPTGSVKDLLLQVSGISGKDFVGGLAGKNYGTISNVYVLPYVVGHYSVGGIVGANFGTIEDSASIGGLINGVANVGGITGANYGLINRTITASLVQGDMATGKVGGIAGFNTNTIMNSFWDTDYTGLSKATNFTSSSHEEHVLGGCMGGVCTNGGTVDLTDIHTYQNANWNITEPEYTINYTEYDQTIYDRTLTLDQISARFGSSFVDLYFPPGSDTSSDALRTALINNYYIPTYGSFGSIFIDFDFPPIFVGIEHVKQPLSASMTPFTSPTGWFILPGKTSYPLLNAMYYMQQSSLSSPINPVQVFSGKVYPSTPGLIVTSFYTSLDYLPLSVTGANGQYYSFSPTFHFSYFDHILTTIVSQNATGSVFVPVTFYNNPTGISNIPLPAAKTNLPFFNPISNIQILYAAAGIVTTPDVPLFVSGPGRYSILDPILSNILNDRYSTAYEQFFGGPLSSTLTTVYLYSPLQGFLLEADQSDNKLKIHSVSLTEIVQNIMKSQVSLDTHTLKQPIYPNCNGVN